jgi:transcription elongation factor GreA
LLDFKPKIFLSQKLLDKNLVSLINYFLVPNLLMAHYITKQGLEETRDELNVILEIKLPKTLQDINTAREEGDLKENAGYQTALKVKDELLARQQELEEILKDYQIIDETAHSKSKNVTIGSNVKVKYLQDNIEYSFRIVGSSESDPLSGKISNESPLAMAIFDKSIGAKVKFKTPKGKLEIQILEVS